MVVRKRNRLGISLDVPHPIFNIGANHFVDAGLYHGAINVINNNATGRTDCSGSQNRQVAGAAADIQDAIARGQIDHSDSCALPGVMYTET